MKFIIPILVLSGVCASAFGVYQLLQSNKSKSWPYVVGVVLESTVEKHEGIAYDSQKTRYTYIEYIPFVEYRYTTEGGEQVSSRVFYGWNPTYETKKEAQEIIKPFKKGKEVKVFYNPKDELYSLIAHADTLKEKAIIILGVLFALMAGGIGGLIAFLEKAS